MCPHFLIPVYQNQVEEVKAYFGVNRGTSYGTLGCSICHRVQSGESRFCILRNAGTSAYAQRGLS